MATPHIPDLDSIKALKNKEHQFYAIVGAVISLSGTFEVSMFNIFHKAIGLDRDAALDIFFLIRDSGARHNMVKAAMKKRLEKDASLQTDWDKITALISTVLRSTGPRNLIAHNFITCQVLPDIVRVGDHVLAWPPHPAGLMSIPGDKELVFRIEQDDARAEWMGVDPRTADFRTLYEFAGELRDGIATLQGFLGKM